MVFAIHWHESLNGVQPMKYWIAVLYTWNKYTIINQVCFNLKKKREEETRALHSTAQTKLQCVSSFLGVFVSCLIHRIWAGAQLSIPLWVFLSSLASLHRDYRWQVPTRVSLSFPCCFQGHTDGKSDKKGWSPQSNSLTVYFLLLLWIDTAKQWEF